MRQPGQSADILLYRFWRAPMRLHTDIGLVDAHFEGGRRDDLCTTCFEVAVRRLSSLK